MLKFDGLSKRLGLFLLIYIGLLILSAWGPMRQAHNVYYSRVGKAFFNLVNRNYHSDWQAEAPPNDSDWDTTIKLYSKEKHGDRLNNERYLRTIQPQQLMYNNFYSLAFLPLLFLIALYIITPGIVWYEKIWRFLISLFILNVFLAFHESHMIENVSNNNGEVGPTLWHKIIALFGFYGYQEAIYVIAALAWGILVAGKMMRPTKSE